MKRKERMTMNNKKILFITLLGAAFASLNAAGQGDDTGRLRIVTTTGIISDVTGEIAGDLVDQYRLIPPGQDPHSYEPTPRDMAMVEKADLIFVNGFDLEEGLLSVIENVHTGKIIEVSRTVVAITEEEHEENEEPEEDEEHHHSVDPHTWMSPRNVLLWTDVIVKALSEADKVNSSVYSERGLLYSDRLKSLDMSIEEAVSSLPSETRILMTDHDVFGYFARDYGFKVAGTLMKGFLTADDPSSREIADLIELLKREQINAVFIGESSGTGIRKLADTVSRESEREISVIELLTGSLKPSGQQGDSYIGMMEYNVKSIVTGLSRP